MQFDSNYFLVAGHKVQWGTTLLELKAMLNNEPKLKPYEGAANIRIECKEAYGFSALTFEADAPDFHLPVQKIRFKLAPPSKDYEQGDPTHWMPALLERLGKPDSERKRPILVSSNPSGSVVYNATWRLEDVQISLSVFGGVRQETAGLSAAGLYLNWQNVVKAAAPFVDKNKVLEQKLELYAVEAIDVNVFELLNKQPPFVHYPSMKSPYRFPVDEVIRRSHRALYRPNLVDTPSEIKSYLAENEVAIWLIENGNRFVLSTIWDSVVIDPKGYYRVGWVNLLPARGAGRMSFSINGFSLQDDSSSKKLTAVVEKVQELLPQPINCYESYDC